MIDSGPAFAFAESVFEREQRREEEIKNALRLEGLCVSNATKIPTPRENVI
jgi:hypothetical protein